MATKLDYANERGLLACVIADPTILDGCTVEADDFARPQHGNLWRLLAALREQGHTDTMLVELVNRVSAAPTDYDGVAYVVALPTDLPSVEAWPAYASRVATAGHRARLLITLAKATEAAKTDLDPSEVIAHTEAALSALALRRAHQADPWQAAGTVALTVYDALRRYADDPAARMERVLPLPWPTVTTMLRGGMRRGEMVVLAGRPGTGKTAAAMQIVEAAAAAGAVLVVSLEMRSDALMERDLARVAAVDHTRLTDGRLSQSDWSALVRAVETMQDRNVWLLDTPAMTISKIAAAVKVKVTRLRQLGADVKAIMVDYLQLVAAEATKGPPVPETQALADVSKALTALAKVCDVAVLAVAQMNRNVESRGDGARPRMSDLRGSGQIEQDAAAILFTSGVEETEVAEAHPDWRTIVIAKARHGLTGEVPAVWIGERMTLAERDDRY